MRPAYRQYRPDPDAAPATVGPIIVLQPEVGAFLRDTDLRRSGPVGLSANDSARPDRPTAIVGIICRGKSQKKQLLVERKLVGATSVDFPTEGLDLGEDRCALFSDLIRAGTMTPGGFRYEVRVLDETEELASGTTEFTVVPSELSIPGS